MTYIIFVLLIITLFAQYYNRYFYFFSNGAKNFLSAEVYQHLKTQQYNEELEELIHDELPVITNWIDISETIHHNFIIIISLNVAHLMFALFDMTTTITNLTLAALNSAIIVGIWAIYSNTNYILDLSEYYINLMDNDANETDNTETK